MAQQHFDLLVIGAGAAGSTAASTAASAGKRVALVERDKIGGTCLNYGCDPTKTLLTIGSMLYQAQHAERYGLHIPSAAADWHQVEAYVREVIKRIRGGTSEEASVELGKKGIQVYKGEATFISPHEMKVRGAQGAGTGEQTLTAERIIIASGSKTTVPPIEGLDKTGFITNVEAVSLQSLPHRLAVIGGGAIGMEFSQIFSRFGVEVTVLEHAPHLLDKEDRELADRLCDLLSQEGIRAETGVTVQRAERTDMGKRLTIRYDAQGREETVEVDEILVAAGRSPNFESLQIEKAGIEKGKKGIGVDATLCTNVPHIWAVGDVNGGYQFTHVAYEQGKLAAQNAFAAQPKPFDGRVIPWVTYTDPALSHVGKTEEQLRQEGVQYRVGRMKFSEVERAISSGKTEGLVKLLVDMQGHLLGGHILGADADNLLAPIVVAMHAGLPAEMIASTIFPYPTLSEGVRWAADRIE